MRASRTSLWVRLAGVVCAAAIAVYCGGGGIGGSGGISGFGSVFVNGVEWFTEAAEITLDGEPGTEADLRLGMVVAVQGASLSPTTALAATVRFDDAVQGPVASIAAPDPTTLQVVILGQTVELDETLTQFDPSDPGFGFTSVGVDDVLEVSGYVDGSGTIHATWVQRLGYLALGQTEVELEGTVSGLTATSFAIGPVTVQLDAGTDLSELDDPLENGHDVEVEGILVAAGTVLATSVAEVEGIPGQIPEYSLTGLVSDFVSLADFRVAGQAVDASGAEFEPLDPSFVEDDALVEVEGAILDGVLVAEKVQLESSEVTIRAELASALDVDPAAGRVVLLGVEIELTPDATIRDGRDGQPGFTLADLSAGDFLEVIGTRSGAGPVLAYDLRRDESGDVVLRGPVTGFDAAALEVHVCGVVVALDAATVATDANGLPISPADVFQGLQLGDSVEVVDEADADDSAIDVATEIELAN